MTTAEPAVFPRGARRMGWVLAGLMLLYPIDAILAERASRQVLAKQRAEQLAKPVGSGMQFDVRTMSIHCGPLGWAGAWAFLLGSVWALVAGSLWFYYRLNGRILGDSSRRAFLVVLSGVAMVVGVLTIQANQ